MLLLSLYLDHCRIWMVSVHSIPSAYVRAYVRAYARSNDRTRAHVRMYAVSAAMEWKWHGAIDLPHVGVRV